MVIRSVLFGTVLNKEYTIRVCRKAGLGGYFRKGLFMANKKKEKKVYADKHAAFVGVATPRINKALKAIELLANQSGAAYAPTKAEVADMFATIRKKVDEVEKCYQGGSTLGGGFSFGS